MIGTGDRGAGIGQIEIVNREMLNDKAATKSKTPLS